ncbi:MAG: hypothetical protein H6822_17890 [Planctomycetaceae bacterium]|nr:hypothetical protein [Planctomycetales bacterium]MCB9924058.1 hypothetical protein [Planctomycetaceae bacterium]
MSPTRRKLRLSFEQLEVKSAPSSVLLIMLADGVPGASIEPAAESAVTTGQCAVVSANYRMGPQYATEQLLRFIEDNTFDCQQIARSAMLPTALACEAADEMMRVVAEGDNSFFVLGFYDGGTEL